MDRLVARERAANSGWNRPLEFEGFQNDANSVWIASWQASVLQIVVGMEPSNLRGPRVSRIVCGLGVTLAEGACFRNFFTNFFTNFFYKLFRTNLSDKPFVELFQRFWGAGVRSDSALVCACVTPLAKTGTAAVHS